MVAKHQVFADDFYHAANDLLQVEERLLDLLGTADCSVPRILGVDPETRFIFFEHKGRHTADDLCQTASSSVRNELGRALTREFCHIEVALSDHAADVNPLISPTGSREYLARKDVQALRGAEKGLQWLAGSQTKTHRKQCELLHALTDKIYARPPTLGSMDYNARNVVVDGDTGKPCFIEFAKIGWDRPERRLVQYSTGLGAGKAKGRFVSLMTSETAQFYAAALPEDAKGRLLALDGHHLHFHLNAFAMLLGALESSDEPANRALLAVWRQPQLRQRQLVEAITATLSDDPLCAELRSSIAALEGNPFAGENR